MRGNRSRRTTLPFLLVGMSAAFGVFALASRRRRQVLQPLESSLEPACEVLPETETVPEPVSVPREVPSGGHGFPRIPLAAYVLGLSIALVPITTQASSRLGLGNDAPVCQSTMGATDPSCNNPVDVKNGRDSLDNVLVARQPSIPRPTPIAVPTPEPPSSPAEIAPVYVRMASANSGITYGIATWYGIVDGFGPEDTMANGDQFNPYDPTTTAANRWPLGTWLTVCHEDRCINVRVTDRGAFTHALDLSMAAFESLAPLSNGVIDVTIQVISYP
jgi:rare lipoprotein A (peptidoglycan hydrolase)